MKQCQSEIFSEASEVFKRKKRDGNWKENEKHLGDEKRKNSRLQSHKFQPMKGA